MFDPGDVPAAELYPPPLPAARDGLQAAEPYRPPPPFAPPAARRPARNAVYPAAADPLFMPASAPIDQPRYAGARRRGRFVAAALAVAGVLAVAAALLGVDVVPGGPLRTFALPRHVAEFSLQRSLSAAEIDSMVNHGGFAGFGGAELRSAQVGVYGEGRSPLPSLVLVGLSARADRDVGLRLARARPAAMVEAVFADLGSATPTPVAPGRLGGALACGTLSGGGVDASLGVWADFSTLGIVEVLESRSPDSTGALTRRFRASAEN